MILNLKTDRKINLLHFYREGSTPLYQYGLIDLTVHTTLAISIDFKEAPQAIVESNAAEILDKYGDLLFKAVTALEATVLLDDEDAFFRNMVPAHSLSTFDDTLNASLNDGIPLIFTSQITPSPTRLGFPLLVGKHEFNLYNDFEIWFAHYATSSLSGQKFSISGVPYSPDIEVFIDKMTFEPDKTKINVLTA